MKGIKKGQVLISLLFFVVIAMTILSAAIAVMMITSISTAKMEQGLSAYTIAEGGAENALLRLLRDPNYAGETLSIGNGYATITINGTDPKTIISIGREGNFERTIEVIVTYTDNILTVTSWKEI